MAIILHIDTATEYGAVGLSGDDGVIYFKESESQKDHASFLQPAIRQLLIDAGIGLAEVEAVSVTIGPGSYTGLRVGLASAKGLCYALGKPLIAVNTLQVMAYAAIEAYLLHNTTNDEPPFFCPMIDARRMEVYTAMYNIKCKEIAATKSIIIDENIFTLFPSGQKLIFSGNGSLKLKNAPEPNNFSFSATAHTIKHLAFLAAQEFKLQQFADMAYCEPLYAKPFFTTATPVNNSNLL